MLYIYRYDNEDLSQVAKLEHAKANILSWGAVSLFTGSRYNVKQWDLEAFEPKANCDFTKRVG
jgi:hypothetical protein